MKNKLYDLATQFCDGITNSFKTNPLKSLFMTAAVWAKTYFKQHPIKAVVVIVATVILGLLLIKFLLIYPIVAEIRRDIGRISAIIREDPKQENLLEIGPILGEIEESTNDLERELGIFFLAGENLSWLPIVGEDISSFDEVYDLAQHSIRISEELFAGVEYYLRFPIDADNLSAIDRAGLARVIDQAGIQFQKAQEELTQLNQELMELNKERHTAIFRTQVINRLTSHIYLLDGTMETAWIVQDTSLIATKILPHYEELQNLEDLSSLSQLIFTLHTDIDQDFQRIKNRRDRLQESLGKVDGSLLLPPLDRYAREYLESGLVLSQITVDTISIGMEALPILDTLIDLDVDGLENFDLDEIAILFSNLGQITPKSVELIASIDEVLEMRVELQQLRVPSSYVSLIQKYLDPTLILLQIGRSGMQMSVIAVQTFGPAIEVITGDGTQGNFEDIRGVVNDSARGIEKIYFEWETIQGLRSALEAYQIPESLDTLLINSIDPKLSQLDTIMEAANALPEALGLGEYPPVAYLVLLQNEDEIRATGGFITAIAIVIVDNGMPQSIETYNSLSVDNRSMPYPRLPWQMRAYMEEGPWMLRDANWSPDFPTVAKISTLFYSYSFAEEIHGVVAINQEYIRKVVEALGAVEVSGIQINGDNFLQYLRGTKDEELSLLHGLTHQEWQEKRKLFLGQIAKAILSRITDGTSISWQALLSSQITSLEEKDLLVYHNDELIDNFLKERNWDGGIRRGDQDYLMIVDTNMGYNKVSTEFEAVVSYEVDLEDPTEIVGDLSITYSRSSLGFAFCKPPEFGLTTYFQLTLPCYWNYLRIFIPESSQLILGPSMHIPNYLMPSKREVLPHIDTLKVIDGGYGFGAMLLIPNYPPFTANFSYVLPDNVILENPNGTFTYKLILQKQPSNTPQVSVRLRLPDGATIIEAQNNPLVEGNILSWSTQLNTDLEIVVTFSIPPK